MVSSRRPPTFIPSTPRSQPGITMPAPSWKMNGSPRSQEASNSLPLLKLTPTYWTVTSSPAFASGPVPASRSSISSFLGGAPFGTVTSGLVFSAVPPASAAGGEPEGEAEGRCERHGLHGGRSYTGADDGEGLVPLDRGQRNRGPRHAHRRRRRDRVRRQEGDSWRPSPRRPHPPSRIHQLGRRHLRGPRRAARRLLRLQPAARLDWDPRRQQEAPGRGRGRDFGLAMRAAKKYARGQGQPTAASKELDNG